MVRAYLLGLAVGALPIDCTGMKSMSDILWPSRGVNRKFESKVVSHPP